MSKADDLIIWKSNDLRKSKYLVLDNEDSFAALALPYTRTSTPLPTRKHPAKVTNYSINMGYEKWAEKLNNPPTRLKVKGVKYPPEGIISGHLIPYIKSPPKREIPQIVLENVDRYGCIIPSLLEETNTKKYKHSISEKFKSIFEVNGKSFIKKTWKWLKSSEDNLCINGYSKCKCKLGDSIIGSYNLSHVDIKKK